MVSMLRYITVVETSSTKPKDVNLVAVSLRRVGAASWHDLTCKVTRIPQGTNLIAKDKLRSKRRHTQCSHVGFVGRLRTRQLLPADNVANRSRGRPGTDRSGLQGKPHRYKQCFINTLDRQQRTLGSWVYSSREQLDLSNNGGQAT